ncbi:formin-like protein 3 [Ricinus communis]|uniref:formin-like protein 3 n=1 Tax=Ricinus communis TaxID=3988 RepID=UPI000772CFAF|nr:formin-like protein 3 [Ricinus communis]|eukprot:XP_015572699.1 formin-like protein 3 [Ricinus communis]
MELRKAAYWLMILLCTLATERIQGMRKGEMLFENCSPQIIKQIEELAWIHCSKELTDKKDCFIGFDFCLLQHISTKSKSICIHEVISVLPSHLKQEFLNCLRKEILYSGSSVQGASPFDRFIKCFQWPLHWSSSPRRYLIGDSHPHIKPVPSPSLASKRAAATPEYDPALASFLSLIPPTHPLFQKKLGEHQQQHTDKSPPVPSSHANHKHSPPKSHAHKLKKPHTRYGIRNEVFIAVVATAIATFCFVAALFCCWLYFRGRNNRIGSRDRQRDDRPLLHLSDFSTSSSQNSSGFGNSIYKDFSSSSGKTMSLKSNMSMKNGNHGPLLVEAPSSNGEVFPPLKLPPGRPAPPPPQPPAPPPPPAPRPPPPPKAARPPPAPPPKAKAKPSPPVPHRRGLSDSAKTDDDSESGSTKAKLKPFFWDKVMASPDHSMVWHEISSGSFQFNEEMIESLFGYNATANGKNDRRRDSAEPSFQYIQIIDTRKAQNLSILLRALNVTTEEVLDALREGTELPAELLQTLLKMAPTSEEELKLRLFTGDISQLGPAERFLKILVELPFAFKRMESLLFMSSLQEELSTLKESLATLEVASDKLRNSRLFLKLLEAVLKTGNRMNDGTYRGGAQAFKLDTLLKLSDVKGTDGKTTLLHFVVQEIIRSEGIRAVRAARTSQSHCSVKSDDSIDDTSQEAVEHYRNLGLKMISGLSTELEDVRKAAAIDADILSSSVSKLTQSMIRAKAFLDSDLKSLEQDSKFYQALASFVDRADSEVSWISEEEKRIMTLVQSTADYFHGNAGKNEGLRLFTVVRDFLIMVDKACKDVRDDRAARPKKTSKKEAPESSASLDNRQNSDNRRQQLFPAIAGRRIDYSSSDDESPSP